MPGPNIIVTGALDCVFVRPSSVVTCKVFISIEGFGNFSLINYGYAAASSINLHFSTPSSALATCNLPFLADRSNWLWLSLVLFHFLTPQEVLSSIFGVMVFRFRASVCDPYNSSVSFGLVECTLGPYVSVFPHYYLAFSPLSLPPLVFPLNFFKVYLVHRG